MTEKTVYLWLAEGRANLLLFFISTGVQIKLSMILIISII